MSKPVLLWLRRDLRLADQPALRAAVDSGSPVIPVYVLDDETPRHRKMGGASRWWLHLSLQSLSQDLLQHDSRLILRRGRSEEVLADLAEETGAETIHALHHHEPWWLNAEKAVAKAGLDLQLHHGNYLAPPGSVTSGAGAPYRIYTPFWRALQQHMPPPPPVAKPRHIPAPAHWPKSDDLADWHLLPTKPDWAGGFRTEWTPGEKGAHERLNDFIDEARHYGEARNLPSQEGTSRLSPHLAFGEISPAQCWHALEDDDSEGAQIFRSELGWRDYAQNQIVSMPDYGARPANPAFEHFPWRDDLDDLHAWEQGRTGYPIVDAGMRQLWHTGWMHNRVRMIVASLLIKHLGIDWRAGECWFWDTLVDADYAQNSVNWQWSAGSGVDANQFTRIMAPLTQSEKFNAGDYIRQWVPELASVEGDEIHNPSALVRHKTGYPEMIVAHVEGRERALGAYRVMKVSAG